MGLAQILDLQRLKYTVIFSHPFVATFSSGELCELAGYLYFVPMGPSLFYFVNNSIDPYVVSTNCIHELTTNLHPCWLVFKYLKGPGIPKQDLIPPNSLYLHQLIVVEHGSMIVCIGVNL